MWSTSLGILESETQVLSALECVKSWLNAWVPSRRMHDLRASVRVRVRWRRRRARARRHATLPAVRRAAGEVAAGMLGQSPADRLALGYLVDDAERIGAVARLICTFRFYHSVKVPWAAALPPDAGRDAPPAVAAIEGPREHVRVAAERISAKRRVEEAVAQVRGHRTSRP